MKALNSKFKVSQIATCNFGMNKGKEFKIELVLKDGYSCVLAEEQDGKYYFYDDNTLISK